VLATNCGIPNESGGVAIDCVFYVAYFVVLVLQINTCPKQAAPTKPALQPLRNHRVAVNMAAELLGSEPMPHDSVPDLFNRLFQLADFNVSIVNTIFFNCGTISSFEPKAHRQERHGPAPRFPARLIGMTLLRNGCNRENAQI